MRTIEEREKEFAREYVYGMGKYLIESSLSIAEIYETLCIMYGEYAEERLPIPIFYRALCDGLITDRKYHEACQYFWSLEHPGQK